MPAAARTPVDAERGARRVRQGGVVGFEAEGRGARREPYPTGASRLRGIDRRFQPGPGLWSREGAG